MPTEDEYDHPMLAAMERAATAEAVVAASEELPPPLTPSREALTQEAMKGGDAARRVMLGAFRTIDRGSAAYNRVLDDNQRLYRGIAAIIADLEEYKRESKRPVLLAAGAIIALTELRDGRDWPTPRPSEPTEPF